MAASKPTDVHAAGGLLFVLLVRGHMGDAA